MVEIIIVTKVVAATITLLMLMVGRGRGIEEDKRQRLNEVGDSMGWTVPPDCLTYQNWASHLKFVTGDVLCV